MKFRDFLNEGKIKITKEKLLDLDVKRFGSTIPLCRKITRDIKHVCDLIEKDGYYLLQNTKTWTDQMLISPDDLGKIENANDLLTGKEIKIGRSVYKVETYGSITNKAGIFRVEGDQVVTIKSNKSEELMRYFDADLLYGINATVTESVARANADENNKVTAWFDKTGKEMLIFGHGDIVNTNKHIVCWVQQHTSDPWRRFRPGELVKQTVSMESLFPGAYKKSTIKKSNVFILK